MSNFNVQGFLKTIEQQAPVTSGATSEKEEKIDAVYLSKPENHGRYQLFPMNSTVTNFPFVVMPKTREIKIPRTLRKKDGSEATYDYWVKILPESAYETLDQTGRITSGLTTSESQLLRAVQAAFDALYEEMGGYAEERSQNLTIGKMRKKNYTVFFAKCLQKWGLNNPRQAEKENFSALFVCAAKGFIDTVRENIDGIIADSGGDDTWLDQVYSRNLTGRTGFLSFNISLPANQIGYKLSVDHKINQNQVAAYEITPEEADKMQDPVERFLGWQYDKENRKTFNVRIMEDTLAFINAELSAIRSKKSGIAPMTPPQPQQVIAPAAAQPQYNVQAAFSQPAVAPETTSTPVNRIDPLGGNNTGFETPQGFPTTSPWSRS